jgi:hypothetical protein
MKFITITRLKLGQQRGRKCSPKPQRSLNAYCTAGRDADPAHETQARSEFDRQQGSRYTLIESLGRRISKRCTRRERNQLI